MRILFMGTPDFAAASLEKLYADGHAICAVFTQPDKPKDRDRKIVFSPVKALALEHQTPVCQPYSLRGGEAEALIRSFDPEIIVAVAYGRILPKSILSIPQRGCINVHGSLLPKYRGSAPIQWAVLNGDTHAGVTTMYMDEGMDTGDIIDSASIPVGEYETSGELFDRLAALGAQLLGKTLSDIENGEIHRTAQPAEGVSFAPQLTKSDTPIDWQQPSPEIINKIRGLQPWPVATAVFGGLTFKIHAALKTGRMTGQAPGSVVSAGKNGLEVACGDGLTILVTELQAQGGKRMKAADYLLGHRLV